MTLGRQSQLGSVRVAVCPRTSRPWGVALAMLLLALTPKVLAQPAPTVAEPAAPLVAEPRAPEMPVVNQAGARPKVQPAASPPVHPAAVSHGPLPVSTPPVDVSAPSPSSHAAAPTAEAQPDPAEAVPPAPAVKEVTRDWLRPEHPVVDKPTSEQRPWGAVLAFIIVMGAGLAALYFRKRRPLVRALGPTSLKVLSSTKVGPRAHVVSINVGGRGLLLGVTEQSVSSLGWIESRVHPSDYLLAADPDDPPEDDDEPRGLAAADPQGNTAHPRRGRRESEQQGVGADRRSARTRVNESADGDWPAPTAYRLSPTAR